MILWVTSRVVMWVFAWMGKSKFESKLGPNKGFLEAQKFYRFDVPKYLTFFSLYFVTPNKWKQR